VVLCLNDAIPLRTDVEKTNDGGDRVFLNVLGRLRSEHVIRGGNDAPLTPDNRICEE
jgi:hypothetical protein